ncbi:hypothetical protein ACFQS3_10910 [Glycomyces mayteni]|uniref:Uncharacterized protein n=1 Tax=Glycomyces mayteni TaxID=543887 RepID=A0ABW2D9P7_9ACTN|nr:hypothetical protein GCM10025732_32010 [Glycomyces mayteni]
MDSQTVCIRLPGRGSTTHVRNDDSFISHAYRDFGIDHDLFSRILNCVKRLSGTRRFVIVPSGAGVFLLADLARRLGLDASSVDEVSRHVINAQSQLVHRWFLANGVPNALLVDHPADLASVPADCNVAVVRPAGDYRSTDALWGAAAYFSGAQIACIFKHRSGASKLEVSSPSPLIDLPTLLKDIDHLISAGDKLVFDAQCLDFLVRAGAATWILRFDHPEDIARICLSLPPLGLAKRLVL